MSSTHIAENIKVNFIVYSMLPSLCTHYVWMMFLG